MGWLERIAERMMLKARAEGKLTGIEGEGRPLPDRPIETDSTAAGVRSTAQAGALPPGSGPQKRGSAAPARLSDMPEGPERAALLAEIARLQMRQAIAEEARRRFMRD